MTWSENILSRMFRSNSSNRPLLIAVGIVLLLAAMGEAAGFPVLRFVATPESYLSFLGAGLVALVLRLLILRLQVGIRSFRSGWTHAWSIARRDYITPEAGVRAAVALLALALALNIFGGWKRLIPVVRPFYLDPELERWDTVLHAGRPPWEWLTPLNVPWLSHVLDAFYFHGLAVFLLSLAWLAWSWNPLRNQVLVAVVVLWFLLGSVAATLLSSAGPVFLADSFSAQREYLQGIPNLISVLAQRVMWDIHVSGGSHPYGAISAMPSIHVATPTLLLLAARTRYPAITWPGIAYIALTLLCSVHLGWHYAIDGYVSILAVGAYWWVIVGRSGLPGLDRV